MFFRVGENYIVNLDAIAFVTIKHDSAGVLENCIVSFTDATEQRLTGDDARKLLTSLNNLASSDGGGRKGPR